MVRASDSQLTGCEFDPDYLSNLIHFIFSFFLCLKIHNNGPVHNQHFFQIGIPQIILFCQLPVTRISNFLVTFPFYFMIFLLYMSWPENQGILFFLYFSNISNETLPRVHRRQLLSVSLCFGFLFV